MAVEGGAHGHALQREQRTTVADGAHAHLFVAPDGRLIETSADGAHAHALSDPFADVTEKDGAHTHEVPGLGKTDESGEHQHELGVFSSAVAGGHVHVMTTQDGVVLESLTPGELYEQRAEGATDPATYVPKSAQPIVALTTESLSSIPSEELAATALRLAKLWKRNFDGKTIVLVGKLRRGLVLEAAAAVAEVWKARAGEAPTGALFVEARKYIAAPRLAQVQLRYPGGTEITLDSGRGILLETFRPDLAVKTEVPVFLVRAAKQASPDGDRWSNPWRAPNLAKATIFESPAEGQLYRHVVDQVQLEEGLPGEWFVSKGAGDFNGVLRIGKDAEGQLRAGLDASLLPAVLWPSACGAGGTIPEVGKSALPSSLEQDVPAAYRYWQAKSVDDARAIRDALVEAQLFTSETVKLVNGEARRLEVSFSLPAASAGEPIVPTLKSAVERAAALFPNVSLDPAVASGVRRAQILASAEWTDLVKAAERAGATFLFDSEVAKHVPADVVADRLVDYPGDYLVAYPDSPEACVALSKIGRVFRLKVGHEGLVFVASAPVLSAQVEWVNLAAPAVISQTAKHEVRLLKATATAAPAAPAEERFVLGIVLEPGVVDSQNDTYDETEVRNAAHRFMEEYGNVGLMHTSLINGQVKILESWIAPVAMTLENGQTIAKGTWMLAVRVVSEVLWKEVKEGRLTGFSIGGSAIKRPLAGTPPPLATENASALVPAGSPPAEAPAAA